MRRNPPPPWWFVALVAAVLAVCLRELAPLSTPGGASGADNPPSSLAFWGFFITLAGWIWNGLQAIGQVTLQALVALVNYLWAFAIAVNNAAIALGAAVIKGLRFVWDFLRVSYEFVLKPAWDKLWRFVGWARHFLEELFGPLIKFVQFIRKWVLDIYVKWIRPILDIIGIARRGLQLLAALGLDWARALDRRLADLEASIEGPFRFIINELNQILGWINRIVTADGLFQRLMLIRSLQRDTREVMNVWANAWHRPATDAERALATKKPEPVTIQEHISDARASIFDPNSDLGARIAEDVADLRRVLGTR